MHYNERANGHEIEAKVNDEFEISLSEGRTAGYRWVVKSGGEPVLKLLEETAQPNSPGVGGSGQHVWHFRALAEGAAEIELQYLRPWETSAEPARTFVLKVRVRS
jgi:inhibitor of cysteine peptidase